MSEARGIDRQSERDWWRRPRLCQNMPCAKPTPPYLVPELEMLLKLWSAPRKPSKGLLLTKYYEDFEIDGTDESAGRTITEADIVYFAGASGDHHPLHTDEEFASRGHFGRRIAHGALVFSIATGLFVQMGGPNRALLAYYGIDRLRFTRPVYIGDTVRVRVRVLEKTAKDRERGVVCFEKTVLNQHDETVIAYTDKMLFKRSL